MSNIITRMCGHTEKISLPPGDYNGMIKALRDQDCTNCQRMSTGGKLIRHWIMPKDDIEMPDSCTDIMAFSIEYGRKIADQIIAKYPGTLLAGVMGLPDPIISLDMPVNTDVRSIAEEFNCIVYRKVAG